MRVLGRLVGRGDDAEAVGEAGAEDRAVDPGTPADEALAEAGEHARTVAALHRLPTMQRAALLLRYGQDLPVAEVAALLGVGAGTVKTHLVRGLTRLRAEVGKERT